MRATVVARARLRSVSAGAEHYDSFRDRGAGYVGTLEHRFEVIEYLKGTGGAEVMAVVHDLDTVHTTRQGAVAVGKQYLALRDTTWDAREAVIFLREDIRLLPSSRQTDRFLLGGAAFPRANPQQTSHGQQTSRGGLLGEASDSPALWVDVDRDYYTIASPQAKRWLPEAASGGAAGASDGAQRFLLDVPGSASSGASAQATSTPTITLAEMKARIAEIGREVAAGGGSAAYRECLIRKYEWKTRVNFAKAGMKGAFGGRGYFYARHDQTIDSGAPAGTRTYRDDFYPGYLVAEHGEVAPNDSGEFRIIGTDAQRFIAQWPGVVDTARPLPDGEYRFYFSYHPQGSIICNGMPEEEQKRHEVFVTVTAPAGTVHEAFFDIFVDAAGVPLPSDFTVGGASTAIHWLEWRDGTVLLLMAPYADLKGHTLDFIALNGTVALSLDAGAATADPAAGTLTWAVASQPWREGDELMLRIRKGATGPTATPTPTSTPTPSPTPTATPTPTPVPLTAPDAPANLAAAAEPTAVGLTWEAVAGAARYRVEHRPAGGTWTTDDEQVGASPYQVTGLTCATAYEFRVSAYGDGSARAADWGTAATLPASTAACPPTPTPTPKPTPEPLSPVVAKYDLNGNGRIEATEYYAAAWDYGAGKITYAEVLEVAEAFRRSAG